MAKKKIYTGEDLATVSNKSYAATISILDETDMMIRTQVGEHIMTHTIISVDLFNQLVGKLNPKSTTIAELDKQGLI